ncbi:secreted protein [Melampsora americana]|nr:secreted protein [Melampsora americana]
MISNSILAAGVAYLFAFCAQSSFGLTITRPAQGDAWDPSQPLSIQWTTAPGDPQQVDVKLTNLEPTLFPTGWTHEIQEDLPVASLATTISDVPGIVNGAGYRVILTRTDSDEVLAQSAPFSINIGGAPLPNNGTLTNSTLTNSTNANMTHTGNMTNMTHDMTNMTHTNTTGMNTQNITGNHTSNPMSAGSAIEPMHLMGLILSVAISFFLC